ncbi:MAG: hydrogenase iron-sulfur subunit, partial [Methanosarcinales archaeon]|nr:hydrogenase iron-sulfur subunit [Methanosarcinales archaeon]
AGRLHLEWVSAAEGKKFQETITEFVEKIRTLGPSPLKHKGGEE